MGDAVKDAWISRVLGFEAGADDDPDFDESAVASSDGYREYLQRALKQLRSRGSAQFGLVLGAKPEEHRIALHPTRAGNTLAAKLVKQTGLHVSTWGTAMPDPDRATTMLVEPERPVSGLKRRGEQMLRAFMPLPFAKIAIRIGSEIVEDGDEGGEPGEEASALSLLFAGTADASARADAMGRTRQAQALTAAARGGAALCEECPASV
jgi:hypothetical protein